MNLERTRRSRRMGHDILLLTIDGEQAVVADDLSQGLLWDYGVVYLGLEWRDKISVTVRDHDLKGATDDPDIVAAVKEWATDIFEVDSDA